jgi:uncharacterized protein YggE
MGSEAMPYVVVILAIVIAIVIMLFFALGSRVAHNKHLISGFGKTHTITITASGFASAKPSEADMSLVVNGTGKTSQEAVENLSTTLQAFNSTIGSYIDNNFSLVTTTYLNVYPRIIYNYSSGFANRSGYIATEDLLVKLPSIDSVGSAVESLSSIPNIYVSYVIQRLSDSQITAMRSEALSDALTNATSQAAVLVGAGNLTVGNISINNYYVYPYNYANSMGKADIAAPLYYGGMNQIVESITVTFSYGNKVWYWK